MTKVFSKLKNRGPRQRGRGAGMLAPGAERPAVAGLLAGGPARAAKPENLLLKVFRDWDAFRLQMEQGG